MVEVFFSIITRQAIRRGSFNSVKELTAAIGAFIDGWNQRCHPFTWTKTADDILPHARKQTSDAGHCREHAPARRADCTRDHAGP